MKTHIFFALLCFITVTANSQNLDHLMTRRYVSCQDIEYNSSFLVPGYFQKGEIDSLNYVLDYWQKRCGYNSLIFQTRTLLDIQQRKFNEASIDRSWIYQLMDISVNQRPYEASRYSWRFNYTNSLYYGFIDSLARDLDKNDLSESERFLVRLYSGNANMSDLKDKYPGSKINVYYSQFVDSISRLPEFTMSLYTGGFFPAKSGATLGNHGLIGFGFGGIFYKNSIDLLLDFKFGPPKEPYNVLYNDSIITSDKYTGTVHWPRIWKNFNKKREIRFSYKRRYRWRKNYSCYKR